RRVIPLTIRVKSYDLVPVKLQIHQIHQTSYKPSLSANFGAIAPVESNAGVYNLFDVFGESEV
ncbi:hypothetical protein ACT453_57370, partial [Bacillus sp. D-CC]